MREGACIWVRGPQHLKGRHRHTGGKAQRNQTLHLRISFLGENGIRGRSGSLQKHVMWRGNTVEVGLYNWELDDGID